LKLRLLAKIPISPGSSSEADTKTTARRQRLTTSRDEDLPIAVLFCRALFRQQRSSNVKVYTNLSRDSGFGCLPEDAGCVRYTELLLLVHDTR